MSRENPDQTPLDDEVDGEFDLDESTLAKVVKRLDRQYADERQSRVDTGTLVGQRYGKYIVHEIVGRGAFGIVYRATDERLHREVALKVPRFEVLVDVERWQRFQREAVAAAKLEHTGIVPIYEAEFSGSDPYIAFAYCPGPDLGKWLNERATPATAREAAALVARLADAVHYAHGKGVLHRDLKPSNVLLEPLESADNSKQLCSYQPRLTDFGLAKLLEAGLKDTRSSLLVGTPHYLAPEQLSGDSDELDSATDTYALGVILFELVTLRTPFEGSTYVQVLDQLRNAPPPKLCERNREVPRDYEAICHKCLAKDPSDRYATAAALREDLERFVAGQAIAKQGAGWIFRFLRWCQRPERLTTCGFAAFCSQIFLGLWTWAYVIVSWQAGILDGILRTVIVDCTILTIGFSLPVSLLAWMIYQGRRWPFWLVLIMLAIQLVSEMIGLMTDDLVLSEFYPNIHAKLAAYTMLMLITLFQLVLFVLAIPAWYRSGLRFRAKWRK